MDGPAAHTRELDQALRELELINHFLGGYHVVRNGLSKLLFPRAQPWRIVDYGCGGGDVLRVVADWARLRGISVELTGVDYNARALAYARSGSHEYPHINFELGRVGDANGGTRDRGPRYDIALCNLFCHHFTNAELVPLLNQIHRNAAILLVNDLHRHPFAYHAIRLLTHMFSRSPMVKHDAPLSVLRAFRRTDLVDVMAQTSWQTSSIRWMWAFRFQVIGHA